MKVLCRLKKKGAPCGDDTLKFQSLPHIGDKLIKDEHGNGFNALVDEVLWVPDPDLGVYFPMVILRLL